MKIKDSTFLVLLLLLTSCNTPPKLKTSTIKCQYTFLYGGKRDSIDILDKNNRIILPIDTPQEALKISLLQMIPIYGHSQLSREQPFVVQESDVYWSIEGTLPEDVKGGTIYVSVSKESGEVIDYFHDE